MTKTVQTSETRLRAVGIALALAIVLVPAVVATGPVQAQTFTVLYSFTGGADGGYPYDGLIQDASGNLYGTTYQGGTYGYGTVFMVDQTGKETVLYSFAGAGGDGANPYAGLVQDASGELYGTTYGGGASGYGTVFMLDQTGKETVLYSFTGSGGDGANPYAGLLQDASGNLYGTTYYGGHGGAGCRHRKPTGCGTVFELDTTGKETVLYAFPGTGLHGANPYAGLIQDTKGNLWGTTVYGGRGCPHRKPPGCDSGTVFKVDKTGKETVVHTFPGTGNDGAFPYAGLLLDATGNLWGTTVGAGGWSDGVVFEMTKSGKELQVWNPWGQYGTNPYAGLVQDAAGNLYGTNAGGGAYGYGVVFTIYTNCSWECYAVLHSFAGAPSDGATPYAGLVWDAKGNLYGTTYAGGAYGYGVVFELTP